MLRKISIILVVSTLCAVAQFGLRGPAMITQLAQCSQQMDALTGTTTGSNNIFTATGNKAVATKFVATNTYDACRVVARVSRTGSPAEIGFYIFNHDSVGDQPSTANGASTGFFNVQLLPTSEGDVECVWTSPRPQITNGVTYWLVCFSSAGSPDAVNYANWYYVDSTPGGNSIMTDDADLIGPWTSISTTQLQKFTLY